MDDMTLFDRFHAAFDVAPPAGGFERLRRELSSYRPARRGRPAFDMRHNKMTLRLAAVAAVAVIAIALVSAYLSAQRPTTEDVPAGAVSDYQALTAADHDALINTYSNTACIKFTDPTCATAVAALRNALRQWSADLKAFRTPPRFAVLDRQLRLHLDATVVAMNVASAAITSGSESAFNAAVYGIGDHQAPWFDSAYFAIVHSKTANEADYKYLVHSQQLLLQDCAGCQDLAGRTFDGCTSSTSDLCNSDVTQAAYLIGTVFPAMVQVQGPTKFGDQASRAQADLAKADTALLDLQIALFSGSPAGSSELASDRSAFRTALLAVDSDLAAILG